MKFVRVGIIGVGNMGYSHAFNIAAGKIDGMVLSALCDTDPARQKVCKEKFPDIIFTPDYTELFKKDICDAVIIATPHRLHADIAIKALEAGLHILTEKPMDIRVSKARLLCETAKKSDRIFGIMFNQRTNPIFARAREIVQTGKLGELKRSVWIITNWYRTQYYYNSGGWRATWGGEGGGVLINQAPHNLDIWQWICGMPTSITAFCDTAKYHNIEVEDDVTIFARYENGATGTFITTTGETPGTNRFEISGTKGKMVLEQGILKLWLLKENERDICFGLKQNFVSPETEYSEFRPDTPETAHNGILQNFANAILFGEPLLAAGVDGINELMISNAAYLSQWTGNRECLLPIDAEAFDRELDKKISQSDFCDKTTERVISSDASRWQVRW